MALRSQSKLPIADIPMVETEGKGFYIEIDVARVRGLELSK